MGGLLRGPKAMLPPSQIIGVGPAPHPPPSSYAYAYDVSCGMFSNLISLVLRDSDTGSENVSLIRLSVSYGQKACGSKALKGVSLIINTHDGKFI